MQLEHYSAPVHYHYVHSGPWSQPVHLSDKFYSRLLTEGLSPLKWLVHVKFVL